MKTEKSQTAIAPAAKQPVDKDIQTHLGQTLKASYDDLIKQPVPDKFRLLLEELERREKKP